MPYDTNPFSKKDTQKHSIWEKVVRSDINAFLAQDWSLCEKGFVEENFMGIHANWNTNPDFWELKYDSLETYKNDWLDQAREFNLYKCKEDKAEALFKATKLENIQIKDNSAILHKKFDGSITLISGEVIPILWQTIYNMKKINKDWKITSFVGYLPNKPKFFMPKGARQHKTAGPYSPVLEVEPSKIVVISGQASIDKEGNVVGNTIEEQTQYTLESCKKQLNMAGVGLKDVFKVNAWLTNLDEWERFNKVYSKMMTKPYPVRAVVQSGLLYTFKVEIEMWAVKR